jgi:hypothetical protein
MGEGVQVLCQPESAFRPYPEVGQSELLIDYPLLYGSAASALARGADGVYLFNECYRVSPGDRWASTEPHLLRRLFHDVGDPAVLRDMPRRHPVGYAQVVGPGAGDASPLPVRLTKPKGSWSFGRHGEVIALRLCVGLKPERARLRLEIGLDTAGSSEGMRIWLNGHPLVDRVAATGLKRPSSVTEVLSFEVSGEVAQEDVNVLEVLPSAGAPGSVVWAELAVLPRPGGPLEQLGRQDVTA